MTREMPTWLYGYRLAELCDLPGLPENIRVAIGKIEEVKVKHGN